MMCNCLYNDSRCCRYKGLGEMNPPYYTPDEIDLMAKYYRELRESENKTLPHLRHSDDMDTPLALS